jgi:hypothetical protein
MQQDAEYFSSTELTLIYIAKRLKEALDLEEKLSAAGFEYLVEPDTYKGGIIFASERIGAFFYVRPDEAEQAREVLRANRYKPYEPA